MSEKAEENKNEGDQNLSFSANGEVSGDADFESSQIVEK